MGSPRVLPEGLQGTGNSATQITDATGCLSGTKSLPEHKQGQLLLQSGSQRQSRWDPALGVNPTLYPILGSTAGTWHCCGVGADPCACPQAGTAWWGAPGLISRAFQGNTWCCSPRLAHALTSPPNLSGRPQVSHLAPDLLLVILGRLEGGNTRFSETNPRRGRMFVQPCTSVCLEGWEGR